MGYKIKKAFDTAFIISVFIFALALTMAHAGSAKQQIKFSDGSVYTGKVRNGKMSGWGVLEYANGDKIEGEFVNGKKTNYGFITWADGTKYSGPLLNGKPSGKGKLIIPGVSRYEGEFLNGKKHGFGTEVHEEFKYQGDYENGQFSGQGSIMYGSSTFYGDFKNGQPHGQGRIVSYDGSAYVGEYLIGEFTSRTYTLPGGQQTNDTHKDGKLVGSDSKPAKKTVIVKKYQPKPQKTYSTNTQAAEKPTTPTEMIFPVHFKTGNKEYSKTPPKGDFLGKYMHEGGMLSGHYFPDKYLIFREGGEGVFRAGNVSRRAEWAVEIQNGKPKTFTARKKELQTGTAYRIQWKCIENCENVPKYAYIMVDTHWPKTLLSNSVYDKTD